MMPSRPLHRVSLLLLLLISPARLMAEELAIGIASGEITPPPGYRMSGYYNDRVNTGTKDPLFAKAVVFRQGGTSVQTALVFCDLIGIPSDLSARARKLAQQKSGIRPEAIAICATHSHTGPLYYGVLRQHFHRKAVAAHGVDSLEAFDYPKFLVEKIAGLIAEAQAKAAPTRIAAGFAKQENLSFNRRFHMKDGTVVFNPGKQNPAIVRVAGPIDPDVGLVAFYDKPGNSPAALLSAFALHLDTVGGTEYSADYPHHLEVALRKTFGPQLVSLFGAGTCGDINHIDVRTKGNRTANEIGTELAQACATAVPKLETLATPSLGFASAVVDAPLQHYSDDEFTKASQTMDRIGDRTLPFLEGVKAVTLMDLKENYPGKSLPMEVQAFRLDSQTAIVTLPGEVFVELGLAIKKASPFRTTILIELANDSPAYIPTAKAFTEGSYEVANSRIATGGGELLVKTATQLLNDLAH